MPNSNRNKTRHNPSMRRQKDVKNSSIPRLTNPKPVNNYNTPRNKKAAAEKISKNPTEENSPVKKGIFLTQDAGEEDDASVTDNDPGGLDLPNVLKQQTEDTNTHNKVDDNSNIGENIPDQHLDTSSQDRTITKYNSTDSGIADIESVSRLGPRYVSEINAGIRKEYFQGLDNLRKMISGGCISHFFKITLRNCQLKFQLGKTTRIHFTMTI